MPPDIWKSRNRIDAHSTDYAIELGGRMIVASISREQRAMRDKVIVLMNETTGNIEQKRRRIHILVIVVPDCSLPLIRGEFISFSYYSRAYISRIE